MKALSNRNRTIMIVHAVVMLLCALSCIHTIVKGSGSGGQQLPAVMCLAALIVTFWYAIQGYKKSVANYYKLMLGFCACASLMCIVPHMYNSAAQGFMPTGYVLCTLGYALSFGIYLILALVPDLGMVKSGALIGVVFTFYVVIFIFSLVNQTETLTPGGSSTDLMRIFRQATMWVLALSVGISTYFKYTDKLARGSH